MRNISFFFFFFYSCRSLTSISASDQKEKRNIRNDITMKEKTAGLLIANTFSSVQASLRFACYHNERKLSYINVKFCRQANERVMVDKSSDFFTFLLTIRYMNNFHGLSTFVIQYKMLNILAKSKAVFGVLYLNERRLKIITKLKVFVFVCIHKRAQDTFYCHTPLAVFLTCLKL